MRKIIWLVATALVLAGGVYWAKQKFPEKFAARGTKANGARPSSAPTTFAAAIRDIHFAVTAAGDIGPLDAVSVRPEIGGLIAKLTLDIGDKVKKGEVLFELDDKDLQTEKVTRKTEIAGARLAVETQKLQLEKAKLNFDRMKGLFESKLVAQEAFDNARIDHDLTKNSLDKNRGASRKQIPISS